jgi:hypothetical protein
MDEQTRSGKWRRCIFTNHTDNDTQKNNKKKMRALGAFQAVLSKHYTKRLPEKTKKMEMKKIDHYLILLLGLQLVQ